MAAHPTPPDKGAWRRQLRDAWLAWSRTERDRVSAAICAHLQAVVAGRQAPALTGNDPSGSMDGDVRTRADERRRPAPAGDRPPGEPPLTHPDRERRGVVAEGGAGDGPRRSFVTALMLYAPLATEVDVTPLLPWARRRGLAVLLPWVDPVRQVMEARVVGGWEDTVEGPWGLRQPHPGCPIHPLDAGTLVVVPGLAFDRLGWRLGRGGGYYDRFLDRHPAAWRAGVVPAAMLFPAVPRDPQDRRMDLVVTESGILGPWWGVR